MKELQVFKNPDFGQVRTYEFDGVIWFVAKDICDCLELKNTTAAMNRLENDERAKFNLGRQGETNCVNEYGLYALILASRKKEAKDFKRWITHEVIPSIRKTGGYIAGQESMSDIELLSKAVLVAQKQIEERNQKIQEMTPKALFADAVSASDTSILIGDLAKLICQNGVKIGQKRLFQWMRENGYLIKQKGTSWNMPTQRSIEMGLFEVKETTITHSDGHITVNKTVKVTGKAQVYFVNKFLSKKKSESSETAV